MSVRDPCARFRSSPRPCLPRHTCARSSVSYPLARTSRLVPSRSDDTRRCPCRPPRREPPKPASALDWLTEIPRGHPQPPPPSPLPPSHERALLPSRHRAHAPPPRRRLTTPHATLRRHPPHTSVVAHTSPHSASTARNRPSVGRPHRPRPGTPRAYYGSPLPLGAPPPEKSGEEATTKTRREERDHREAQRLGPTLRAAPPRTLSAAPSSRGPAPPCVPFGAAPQQTPASAATAGQGSALPQHGHLPTLQFHIASPRSAPPRLRDPPLAFGLSHPRSRPRTQAPTPNHLRERRTGEPRPVRSRLRQTPWRRNAPPHVAPTTRM